MDTVFVAPGNYEIDEPITYRGKAIAVKSLLGPENTSVTMTDPKRSSLASVFLFNTNETEDALLEGFTIQGGTGSENEFGGYVGGGVFILGASPTIRGNIIKENHALAGGGMALGDSQSIVERNVISSNSATNGNAGGILLYRSSPKLTYNQFLSNVTRENGGGIACTYGSDPEMRHNLFVGNKAGCGGGAIFIIDNSDPSIINCTIYGNSAGCEGGGGIYRYPLGHPGNPEIINSILWSNIPNEIFRTSFSCFQYSVIDNCIFIKEPNNQNTCQDPLFMNAENGNFCLSEGSPCIDAGNPDMKYNDPDGSRADIGAYQRCKPPEFIRGDVTGDQRIDIMDPLITLCHLFLGQCDVRCRDAADSNDDGTLNLADPIFSLNHLYAEGPQPPAPYPAKGADPSNDSLTCAAY